MFYLEKNMKIEVVEWSIDDLIQKERVINPKPQYQRTSVWSQTKKQLLIDSILRGYDLPKFYLRETPNDLHFEYEVTDGQQRMRAIWEYFNPITGYGLSDYTIGSDSMRGVKIDKLRTSNIDLYNQFLNFKLNVAIIKDATQEEIRTLFARLQMGERLNPVELRHAISSNLGNVIVSTVETHQFFKDSKISEARYKHQDYLDNALTASYYDCQKSVGATEMKLLYSELANATIPSMQPMMLVCQQVLNWMLSINQYKKGIFKNKWTFVDTFYLLYKNHNTIRIIHPQILAEGLSLFETKRKKHNKVPELLIDDKGSLAYDKDMYDYILAFKNGGSEKNNLRIRHRVFNNYFLKQQYIETNN